MSENTKLTESGKGKVRLPLQVQPEDIQSVDNTTKAMIFASYMMAQNPDLLPEKAVELAIQLTTSTDIGLKREHEEAARRHDTIRYGFLFSVLCRACSK